MGAGSQVSGWTFTKYRHVKSILCELFQFGFDSTQRPRRIAGEYFRIIETIENSYDQDLTRLQIALNGMKTGPDFFQCFQRPRASGTGWDVVALTTWSRPAECGAHRLMCDG